MIMKQTSSRAAALEQVMRGVVRYDVRTGVFMVEGAPLTGARRRTYSYLRTNDVVEPEAAEAESAIKLTSAGVALAEEWGLTSRANIG